MGLAPTPRCRTDDGTTFVDAPHPKRRAGDQGEEQRRSEKFIDEIWRAATFW